MKKTISTLVAVASVVAAYLLGASHNAVTSEDRQAYKACMAYYNDADHCFQDTIQSWQI